MVKVSLSKGEVKTFSDSLKLENIKYSGNFNLLRENRQYLFNFFRLIGGWGIVNFVSLEGPGPGKTKITRHAAKFAPLNLHRPYRFRQFS
jgi:hypothetical protein